MADQQRILSFENGFNFRELGGYPSLLGTHLKWGKLLRTAQLASLSHNEQKRLYDYGIRTVIDFRSAGEVAVYPDRVDPRISYLRLPVFNNDITDSRIDREAARRFYSRDPHAGFNKMMVAYRQFVTDEHAQEEYHNFFKALCLTATDGGVIFHCSAGKDRTGLAAIYLLSVLAVPSDTIHTDYLLTNKASVKRINQRLQFARQLKLGPNYQQSIYDLSTANQRYYEQAISLIKTNYGGMTKYIHDVLQVSDSMVEQLRYRYLQ